MTYKSELIREPSKTYILKGLGCANCAAKMEAEIRHLPGVSKASLDFISTKLRVVAAAYRLRDLEAEIKEIVSKYEPDVVVKEEREEDGQISRDLSQVIEDKRKRLRFLVLALGVVLYLTVVLLNLAPAAELILYLASYALIGGEVILRAAGNIRRGQVFDENFLMMVATIGALAIGEYAEAVAVMLFYQIGETFQDYAVDRSRRSIQALLNIRPDYANLIRGEEIVQVEPGEVRVGEMILVKPGERVPLDGVVTEGSSLIDTSALTGESVPRQVEKGDDVLGGFINNSGLLRVQVTKEFGQSTVARILDLVENAHSKKAPTESFITKFARYYTPAVVYTALALAVIPSLMGGGAFSDWFYRALIFLVISCPCALVISIPLSFFGGIGGASRNGVLVKGGNYLEALNKVDTVVFDKTGTLTKGVFKVTGMVPENGLSAEELLEYAALAECYSNHPIAQSIMEAYGKETDKERLDSYEELAGLGIKAVVEGKTVLAGSKKLLLAAGVDIENRLLPGTVVHVAVDGKYGGYLLIADEIKEDSPRAIKELRKCGVRKLYMLTGDSQDIAAQVALTLELDEAYGGLLPQEKVARMEMLYQQKGKGSLVFVGDGINDAPVLARADVGVAMGGLGSDAAIEAADVVLMTDEPSKLVTALKIARRTKSIVWQNIIFSLGVKGIVLLLGAGGLATIWEAVFADVGVALLAILNALRVMGKSSV